MGCNFHYFYLLCSAYTQIGFEVVYHEKHGHNKTSYN